MKDIQDDSEADEKKYLDDAELIEKFIEELEGDEAVEKHRQKTGVNVAKAEYRLFHEYSGEKFMQYLIRNDEVKANVRLHTEYEDSSELYTGHITAKATEIFSPSCLEENSEETHYEKEKAFMEND